MPVLVLSFSSRHACPYRPTCPAGYQGSLSWCVYCSLLPLLCSCSRAILDHLFDAAQAQLSPKAARSDAPRQPFTSPNMSSASSSSPSSLSLSLSSSPGSNSHAHYQRHRPASHSFSSDIRHNTSDDAASSLLGLSLMDRCNPAMPPGTAHYASNGRSGHSTAARSPGSLNSPITPLSPGSGPDSVIGIKDGKRHTCPHCGKRFNRPSSLGIHINTHTGVKRKQPVRISCSAAHEFDFRSFFHAAFECPFAGCGRQFNVSSNMRRHYRNHSSANAASHNSDTSYSNLLRSPAGISQSLPTAMHFTSMARRPEYSGARPSESNSAAKKYPYAASSTASYPSPSRSEISLSSDGGDERDVDAMSERSGRSTSRPYGHSYAGGPERTSHVRRSSASSTSPYTRYQRLRAPPPSSANYSQEPVYTFPPPLPPSSAIPMAVPPAGGRRYSGVW